jgi:anti-sigma factor RsiW
MPEHHPDELELLAYAEEELPVEKRRRVGDHLDACRSCAERVQRLEAGRHALRSAPLLEPSTGWREEVVRALPEQPGRRRPFASLRRLVTVAAPVAAAAALIAGFVVLGTLGGGGDNEEGAAVGAATAGQVRGGGGGSDEAAPAGNLVRRVRGPAGEVARLLRRRGIPADVADGRVSARKGASAVRAALAGRPSGRIAVYVP